MLTTTHLKKGDGFIFEFLMWKLNPLIDGRYLDLIANGEFLVKHSVFNFSWKVNI